MANDGLEIFLAPCANTLAQENFEKTVASRIPKRSYGEFTEQDYGSEISVWGMKASLSSTWERISQGDVLLFYFGENTYAYGAEVLAAERNEAFARDLWPNYADDEEGEPWECAVILNPPFSVDIDSRELHGFADYGLNHPQGFQSFHERGSRAIREEYGSVAEYLIANREDPHIWVEKTSIAGRAFKQSGELALGNALFSPQRDKGGGDRYASMREIAIGDVVLHLLQDDDPTIEGVSTVSSPLETDFAGPPDAHDAWNEAQQQQGGYLRRLTDYREFDRPVDPYEDVFEVPQYQDRLRSALDDVQKAFYTSKLSLAQGAYLTRCPETVIEILGETSDEVQQELAHRGVLFRGTTTLQAVEYESIDEAVAAFRDRTPVADPSANPVAEQLLGSTLEEWSEVLTKIAVQTEVDAEDAAVLSQMQDAYEATEDSLERFSQAYGLGTLYSLNRAETAFTVGLRILQEEADDVPENANHVKLKTILRNEYRVVEPEPVSNPSHPLSSYLEANGDEISVYSFTGPANYWIDACGRRGVTYRDGQRGNWKQITEGDLAFLHSQATPSDASLPEQESGVIGVAIMGDSVRATTKWGLTEEEESADAVCSFDRLFVTGDVEDLDTTETLQEKDQDTVIREMAAVTEDAVPISRLNDRFEEAGHSHFPAQGAFNSFRTEDGRTERERPRLILDELAGLTHEVSPVNVAFETRIELPEEILEGLYYPDDRGESILQDIETAINAGKNVILTGPPGTGKTEIARRVAGHLAAVYPYLYTGDQLTTATADWSTFDTVGGYMPSLDVEAADEGELSFTPGIVLNRLKSRDGTRQVNEPLVIDELNRADIDKAFGQLFTLLSGQSVQLPYTEGGEEIEILTGDDVIQRSQPHEYVVPASWRIFATMNTYDKASLYEMSYAFMRRFAFIRVGAPSLPEPAEGVGGMRRLMRAYLREWNLEMDRPVVDSVASIWQHTNHAVEERSMGPAIIYDMLQFIDEHPSDDDERVLSQAVVSYIFPQLEGVRNRKQIVLAIINSGQVDESFIRREARDMLDTPLAESQ